MPSAWQGSRLGQGKEEQTASGQADAAAESVTGQRAKQLSSLGVKSTGNSSELATTAVTTDPSAMPTSPDSSPQPARREVWERARRGQVALGGTAAALGGVADRPAVASGTLCEASHPTRTSAAQAACVAQHRLARLGVVRRAVRALHDCRDVAGADLGGKQARGRRCGWSRRGPAVLVCCRAQQARPEQEQTRTDTAQAP